ncbi:50S ribosomal protein L16 [Candidatus Woesearchaeota archaeon]|nr:50S ribosomal protein L16 [Candidatus Woesearchaeota archaeon]
MAKLRKGVSYRFLERPYTRKSKYRKLSYVRASPTSHVVRYNMGDVSKKFQLTMNLISQDSLQIRHNAIESARASSNKILEEALGKSGYFYQIRMYPHHILRENPLASGAGADRMSQGMAKPFGKPVGIAAQVKKGKIIFTLKTDKQNLKLGKEALSRAKRKLPCRCLIEVVENKN